MSPPIACIQGKELEIPKLRFTTLPFESQLAGAVAEQVVPVEALPTVKTATGGFGKNRLIS